MSPNYPAGKRMPGARCPQGASQLLPEPSIGRIVLGVGVPIKVGIERRHLQRKGYQPVAEPRVENARGVAASLGRGRSR
jgi:hypothetical protein